MTGKSNGKGAGKVPVPVSSTDRTANAPPVVVPERQHGVVPRLVEFSEELRREGVAVGTSELLDAMQVLSVIEWTNQRSFREALASTVAKSPEDRHVFDLVFERFFFRAAEAEAIDQGRHDSEVGLGEMRPQGGLGDINPDDLRDAIIRAIREEADGALRDLARLAIIAFGQTEGSGVIGVDVQRIRRSLGLRSQDVSVDQPDGGPPLTHDQLRKFERHLRRELEAALIERTGTMPTTRPLNDLNRALPSQPTQDLAAVHRAVTQMKRAMATQGQEQRGRKRSGVVDIRHTMRASLQTGGVPLTLRYKPKRPRRPEIYVLCDVSTSVTSASMFFLSILHALHDSFRRLRSFVFIERVAEVTETFESEKTFKAVAEKISTTAGVADVSGYTDYGRVWLDFLEKVIDDLDPRSTVIVMGDARANGRAPHAEAFRQISEHAGRTFWLNPEPHLYWNYGDSVISAYEPYCDGVFECWRTNQLEDFVKRLTAGG